jgi:polysaccharide deacetylase 2 family uncharacterized protein YibQ
VPSRRLHRRKKQLLLAMAVSLLLLVGVVLLTLYPRLGTQPLGETEGRQLARRFKDVIERAGGSQVWVKEPPYAPFPPPRSDAAAEVLATPASFDAALAAIKQQAESSNLQIGVKVARTGGHWRSADIRLTRGRELAGRWRLREVRQLRRVAIIIDDLGQDLEAARKLLALPYPITLSILPHLRHSVATAEEAHRAGREVILHLPMEPEAPAQPGRGEIRVGMRAWEVERIVEDDLASVPYAVGVNNHMGSRATTNTVLMGEVTKVLAAHRLYFVDSRTTPASVAFDVARREGLATFYRSVFLDDTETLAYTFGQLRDFRRVVDEQGAAIAIGHPSPTTVAALARFLPELGRADIQLVPASSLLQLPEVARLTRPHPTRPQHGAARANLP